MRQCSMPWPATDNGGRAKLSCIEVPALVDGPWQVIFAHRRAIPARSWPYHAGKIARSSTWLCMMHTELPSVAVVSTQKNRVVVRPNARGWRREGFLGGDGGVPRFVNCAHVRE